MSEEENAYLLEADLHVRVSSRCRRAYLHDLRDGLQAISGAVDLLARSSTASGDNRPLIDRASDLSRRAVMTYEQCVAGILDDLLFPADVPAAVKAGDLLQDVIKFLRNDAASKEITIHLAREREATLDIPRRKLRLLLLGVLTALIDRLPPGEEIRVVLERNGADAVIGIAAKLRFEERLGAGSREWLAVTVARNVSATHGGRIEFDDLDQGQRLRLMFPVAADGI
jgi:signal transduction histidine kinase